MQERRKKPWSGPRERRTADSTKCVSDLQIEESVSRFTGMCRHLVHKFEGKKISVLFSRNNQSNFDYNQITRLEKYLKHAGLGIEKFEVVVGEESQRELIDNEFHIVFIEEDPTVVKAVKKSEKSKRAVIISLSGSGGVQTRAGQDYFISYLPV